MAMARSLESQGNLDQAIHAYQEVLVNDDQRADAHHRLAILFDRKGDAKAAQEEYQAAIKKDPKNAELYCDLGYSAYLHERYADAGKALGRAIELDPRLTRAHNNLGLLLARTGHPQDALAEFSKAGCSEPAAHANLAFALALQNRCPEAEQEFRYALSRDPSLVTAQQGLQSLHSLSTRAAPESTNGPGGGGNQAAVPTAYSAPPSDVARY
ncbi:MAG: tetratricopeptide repeat protein [Thermoguttaceae bacterium]